MKIVDLSTTKRYLGSQGTPLLNSFYKDYSKLSFIDLLKTIAQDIIATNKIVNDKLSFNVMFNTLFKERNFKEQIKEAWDSGLLSSIEALESLYIVKTVNITVDGKDIPLRISFNDITWPVPFGNYCKDIMSAVFATDDYLYGLYTNKGVIVKKEGAKHPTEDDFKEHFKIEDLEGG